MKIVSLVIGLVLVTSMAFADVSAKVVSYEKEIQTSGNHIIKVTTEYVYPDGTKHLGNTRYGYYNFSKEQVLADVKWHCETITKNYIKTNRDIIENRKIELIDNFLDEQNNLSAKDKITAITYSIKDLYLDKLEISIKAEGKVD